MNKKDLESEILKLKHKVKILDRDRKDQWKMISDICKKLEK